MLPPVCSATSRQFHLPTPHYDDHAMTIHASLNKVNLNAVIIFTLDFHIWQKNINSIWTMAHIQKLVDVPEIPVTWLYKHMIGHSEHFLPFKINRDIEEGPSLIEVD